MPIAHVKILLERPDHYVYSPNEVIKGKVLCQYDVKKHIRRITLRCVARERTKWKCLQPRVYDIAEGVTKTTERIFKGEHEIMHFFVLIKTPGFIEGVKLFPFSCELPSELPGSATHRFGKVWYQLEVTAERDFTTFPDKSLTAVKEFKVFSPIDLNRSDVKFLRQIDLTDERKICCWCCADNDIIVDVKIQKTAYAPGEKARFKIFVDNGSKIKVKNVIAELVMRYQLLALSPNYAMQKDSDVIFKYCDGGVRPRSKRYYDVEINIPKSLIVPNFAQCRLFSKCAFLKITVVIHGDTKNLEFTVPIILGHVSASNVDTTTTAWNEETSFNGSSDDNDDVTLPHQLALPMKCCFTDENPNKEAHQAIADDTNAASETEDEE